MIRIPLEESTVAAVAERFKYGWYGAGRSDPSASPNGRGEGNGGGYAHGVAPGYAYIIGGGRGYPIEAADVGLDVL